MKRLLSVAMLAAACTTANAAELVIENESAWDIHRIYISSSDQDEWGPDQLEEDILGSGDTLSLSGVDCDTYDFKLVDEDDDVCEVHGVEICGDETMTISNDALLKCQSNTD